MEELIEEQFIAGLIQDIHNINAINPSTDLCCSTFKISLVITSSCDSIRSFQMQSL